MTAVTVSDSNSPRVTVSMLLARPRVDVRAVQSQNARSDILWNRNNKRGSATLLAAWAGKATRLRAVAAPRSTSLLLVDGAAGRCRSNLFLAASDYSALVQ
jgi:hypothetical protein